jgi:hypothetical protein
MLESIVITAGLLAVGWLWTGPAGLRKATRETDLVRLLVVVCFVAGTPTIILFTFGSNAAYGWLFIFIVILLWRKGPSAKHRALAVGLTLVLFTLYSTAAIMLLILTLVFAVFNWRTVGRYAVAVAVYGVAYYAYLSQQVFGTILRVPEAILTILQSENSRASEYVASNPLPSQTLNLIVYGTFGILLLMAAYPKLTRSSSSDVRLWWAFVLSLVVFGLGASSALGIVKGIFRVPEYLTILSLLTIPSLLRGTSPNLRRGIIASLAAVVVISGFIHMTSPIVPSQFLSPQEVAGTDWVMSGSEQDLVIFSDFRLAGPFVANGFLKVIGVSDTGVPPEETSRLLFEIYYSGNPCLASKGLTSVTVFGSNETLDILLVSRRITNLFPGIQGYKANYEPAPGNFTLTYDSIPSLSRLYDNGQAVAYVDNGLNLWLC